MSDDATPHEQPVEPFLTPQQRNLAAKSGLPAALVGDVGEREPDDLIPTIDLGSRQIKRQAIDSLFARAMSGQLPRYRDIKEPEPDVLDERHLHAILLRSGGMKQKAIAQFFGWTEGYTSVILNHPDAQYILTRLVSFAADNVIDMEARIKATAPEAFDTVVEVMRSTPDEKIRSNNAFEILRMAGYGAKKETPAAASINQYNFNNVTPQAIGQLTAAIQESRRIQAPMYELPPTGMVSEPSVLPGSAELAQRVVASGEGPPSNDSPDPTAEEKVA